MEVEQIREGFEETYKYSVGTHLAEKPLLIFGKD